jgi:spermidine/putrescine transport system ATP-binding protein
VGITFILVTHDQEEALIMSDRIAVMFEGQIAQLDPPHRLYTRPASRQVAEFIGVMNFLSGARSAEGIEIAGLGRVGLAPDQIVGSGASLSIGVRPESMSVLFGDAPAERVAEGIVEELAYYGDMTCYDIRFDGADRPVTVSMRNLPGRPVLERGAVARVGWDPAGFMAFAEGA